jgi:hypothetical protein
VRVVQVVDERPQRLELVAAPLPQADVRPRVRRVGLLLQGSVRGLRAGVRRQERLGICDRTAGLNPINFNPVKFAIY